MQNRIDRVKYGAVHNWLRYHHGEANMCSNKKCKKVSKNFSWALKKGYEYAWKKSNFIQLCRQCHALYDVTEEMRQKARDNSLNARKTHCFKGHPLTGYNLRKVKQKCGRIERMCIKCNKLRAKKYQTYRRLNHRPRFARLSFFQNRKLRPRPLAH